MTLLVVDGSYGEGGGQIVRMSIALAALTQKATRVINIRKKRPKPGLAAQHLTAIRAVQTLANARAGNLEKGSMVVDFFPEELQGGRFKFDVGTAGSIALVLQCCLLPSFFARRETFLRIRGGTDVRWSPPIDYFRYVFLAHLAQMRAHAELRVLRRGFYPKGGGEVEVKVAPTRKLKPLRLDSPRQPRRILGTVFGSRSIPEHVFSRLKKTVIKEFIDYEVELVSDVSASYSPGVGLVLWTDTLLAGSQLGERGVPAEKVAATAAQALKHELTAGASVDVHAADQLLPYFALADGVSVVTVRELSSHARTCIWLLEKFLGTKIHAENVGNAVRLHVEGIGYGVRE
jgi:RNA 3'-terminal phosphate cyclase (ATP)/RNA 3'-terminal phosphate cyclase (GTP)